MKNKLLYAPLKPAWGLHLDRMPIISLRAMEKRYEKRKAEKEVIMSIHSPTSTAYMKAKRELDIISERIKIINQILHQVH